MYVTCQVNFANVRSNFALPRQLSGNAQKIIIGSDLYHSCPWIFSIVWPSKYSTLEAFKELTENKILKPYPSATVEVEIIEVRTSDFPATFCKQCDELLTESKLLEAIRVVKWQMLQSSMYDLTKEVSFPHVNFVWYAWAGAIIANRTLDCFNSLLPCVAY